MSQSVSDTDLNVSHEDLVRKGTSFIGVCYGNPSHLTSMSEYRFWKWKSMTKGKRTIFKLNTLPPTTEAFTLRIRRANYQVAVWSSAAYPDLPDMDPSQYGWDNDLITRNLVPIQLPPNTPIAPEGLLQILCCICDSEESCKMRHCCFHNITTQVVMALSANVQRVIEDAIIHSLAAQQRIKMMINPRMNIQGIRARMRMRGILNYDFCVLSLTLRVYLLI